MSLRQFLYIASSRPAIHIMRPWLKTKWYERLERAQWLRVCSLFSHSTRFCFHFFLYLQGAGIKKEEKKEKAIHKRPCLKTERNMPPKIDTTWKYIPTTLAKALKFENTNTGYMDKGELSCNWQCTNRKILGRAAGHTTSSSSLTTSPRSTAARVTTHTGSCPF